jgi:anti-anti-sigma factor
MPHVPDALNIVVTDVAPGIARLSMQGSVDPTRVNVLKDALEALFARKVFKVIVDLKGAKYLSSSGIACFITSLDTATANGGQFAFIAADQQIQRIAQILMLSDVFIFVPDEPAALERLAKGK